MHFALSKEQALKQKIYINKCLVALRVKGIRVVWHTLKVSYPDQGTLKIRGYWHCTVRCTIKYMLCTIVQCAVLYST